MNAILDQYVRENPNVTVSSNDLTALNIPDYRTKPANDLMAGEGPDIVLVSNTTNNTIQNLTKLLQNDIFMDIDTLSPDLSMCSRQALSAAATLKISCKICPKRISSSFRAYSRAVSQAITISNQG